MRKLIIALLLAVMLAAAASLVLIAAGTMHTSSLSMILNVFTGMGGPATTDTIVGQRYQVPEGFRLRRHAPPPRASGKRLFTRGDHRTASPATSRTAEPIPPRLHRVLRGASRFFVCAT